MRPRRRTTRHLSHILFTDGRTFMSRCPSLVPIHHATSREVVWGQLHAHTVPGQDPDVVHPHLPRDVREHLVPVLELHTEHGVGQGLDDRPLDLYDVVLGHAPMGPSPFGFPCRARAEHASTRASRKYTGR